MKKLGEQWIETIDGEQHMVKAVANNQTCYMCRFAGDRLVCTASQEIQNGCDSGWNYCIKDLGPVNEEGCLAMPCDKNVFPEIEKVNNSVWFAKAQSGTVYMESWGIGRKGAVDSWNRRHA